MLFRGNTVIGVLSPERLSWLITEGKVEIRNITSNSFVQIRTKPSLKEGMFEQRSNTLNHYLVTLKSCLGLFEHEKCLNNYDNWIKLV